MLGIVIVCHRQIATYLKDTINSMIGEKNYFEAIEVFPQDGIEGTKKKVEDVIEKWTSISGILFFVDMFGGTPCNSIAKFFKEKKYNFDVVTGVNLPMILTALTLREATFDLDIIVEKIIQENQKAVMNLKKLDIFRG